MSPPSADPELPANGLPEPKNALNRSPIEPNAVEIGGIATRAQTVVAVAVIGGPSLRVGEDLIGLRGLLELLLGGRVVRVDIRVQFAGKTAKGLLDVLLGGVAGHAEHLVGVAWGRGAHQRSA